MMYKTHLSTSLNIAIPALAWSNELSIITLTGVGLGSLLPDIDTPNSFIGRRLKVISYPLSTIFKHRGFLHSLIPVILIFAFGLFLKSLFIKAIALGYFLHLVGDTFSESGIKWFLPFYSKDIKVPLSILRYKTGGLKEYVILGISIVILMLEIQKFHLINLFSI